MDNFTFTDALTGSVIEFDFATGNVLLAEHASCAGGAESVFFPGCSFINYAMLLVPAVYDTLLKAGAVDGISVLCCGKILSYEENGTVIRDAYEEQLRKHVSEAGIKRFICACPNCVKAMREAFAEDERTKDVELFVLPQVMADLGYRIDLETATKLIEGNAEGPLKLCPHDSCPDRESGAFAAGLREVLPEGIWEDPAHSWKKSVCCGSLPRAAGKFEQADRCAAINGQEAVDISADAIVTACMSCAFQLTMAQNMLPAVHFLELLYNWRIDWSTVGAYMKLRFLFDESMGAIQNSESGRAFAGLGAQDLKAAEGVAISEDNTAVIGE